MGSYILTMKYGDGYDDVPLFETTLTDAVEWARYRYGVVQWHCEDADLLEVECPACEGVDDDADVCAAEGCRAIVSEPLRLGGPRDEDSHLRLERISTKESK